MTVGRHSVPSTAADAPAAVRPAVRPAPPAPPTPAVPWSPPVPASVPVSVPWSTAGPDHTQPIPVAAHTDTLTATPTTAPAPGAHSRAALPRRAPGTHQVHGVGRRGAVHPRTVAGLGNALNVSSVLGLDADLGADVVPAPPATATPAAAAQTTGTPATSSPAAAAQTTGTPVTGTPVTGAHPGALRIPGQRRPLLSSGPLPAVPPWSPSSTGPPATPWSTLAQPAVRPTSPAPRTPPAPPRPQHPPRAPQRSTELPAPTAAPRLLAGWLATGKPADLEDHLRRYGELPRARFAGRRGADQLLELTEDAGLRGRGGAGFSTARKMAAVLDASTARRRPVVVANGCESDPTSGKDQLLLHSAPHLVLDGVALAAHAVGADQAILCVPRGSTLVEPLEDAVARRTEDPAQIHVVTTPHRFVASEASALVNFLTGGDARPTSSPPLPAERGVQGRPTLVDNVETLAHLALLARHDADWFRARGTEDSPGTMLCTVGGAVRRPGVYEVDMGTPAGQLLGLAGGTTEPARAVLLGGLGGGWLTLPDASSLPLAHPRPGADGPALGLASLLVLPPDACGLAVTSTIVQYLAGESAGQCGPCMFGLPAIAGDLDALTHGTARPDLLERLRRRLGVIPGRGACSHPDGTVRLAASALEAFADDVAEHARGRPCGRVDEATLPVPLDLSTPDRGWR